MNTLLKRPPPRGVRELPQTSRDVLVPVEGTVGGVRWVVSLRCDRALASGRYRSFRRPVVGVPAWVCADPDFPWGIVVGDRALRGVYEPLAVALDDSPCRMDGWTVGEVIVTLADSVQRFATLAAELRNRAARADDSRVAPLVPWVANPGGSATASGYVGGFGDSGPRGRLADPHRPFSSLAPGGRPGGLLPLLPDSHGMRSERGARRR